MCFNSVLHQPEKDSIQYFRELELGHPLLYVSCSPPCIPRARDWAAGTGTSLPPTARPVHTLLLARELCLLPAHPL